MAWAAQEDLRAIWSAALTAGDPRNIPAGAWPTRPKGRLAIVGAGKAAARMAEAAETHFGPPLEGLAVTVYGYGQPTEHLTVAMAGHPVPDEAGCAAAAKILDIAQSLGKDDLLLVLLSGGASALLTLPVAGVSLADMQATTRALLASGAPISVINTVRKHLSRINGGRLAAAAFPARTVTLAISDVPGDQPSVIGSGPTVGDRTSLKRARSIVSPFADVPPSVGTALRDRRNESVKPWDRRLWRGGYRIVVRPRDMLAAAAKAAQTLGYNTHDLGDRIEGEASAVAAHHAELARQALAAGEKVAILSGGELSVTGATGETAGGRCREYALALAVALGGRESVAALAADTDGIDGTKDAAGAFVLPGDVERSVASGRDPSALLQGHRSGDYFAALGRQLVTGPTYTNVGDFRVILVNPDE